MCCNYKILMDREDELIHCKTYIFCETTLGKYNILCFSLTFLLENVTLYVTF